MNFVRTGWKRCYCNKEDHNLSHDLIGLVIKIYTRYRETTRGGIAVYGEEKIFKFILAGYVEIISHYINKLQSRQGGMEGVCLWFQLDAWRFLVETKRIPLMKLLATMKARMESFCWWAEEMNSTNTTDTYRYSPRVSTPMSAPRLSFPTDAPTLRVQALPQALALKEVKWLYLLTHTLLHQYWLGRDFLDIAKGWYSISQCWFWWGDYLHLCLTAWPYC